MTAGENLQNLVRCSNAVEPLDSQYIEDCKIEINRIFASKGIQTSFHSVNYSANFILLDIDVDNFNISFEQMKRFEQTIDMHLKVRGCEIVKSLVCSGICVIIPKQVRDVVGFGYCYKTSKIDDYSHPLDVVVGLDIHNKPIGINIHEAPHILIAGGSGSGKSTCLNSIITSLLCHATANHVTLLMIDLKRVELSRYAGLNKDIMLCDPIYDAGTAIRALYSMCHAIDKTYEIIKKAGCVDIDEYNATHDVPLQYGVVVIDELAELMLRYKKEVEPLLVKISQIGRAAGAHLICCTQRPSREVVTGLMKVNFSTCICFRVRSAVNSRIVLDESGAENLLDKGDGYIIHGNMKMTRFQAPYLSTKGSMNIINYIKQSKM